MDFPKHQPVAVGLDCVDGGRPVPKKGSCSSLAVSCNPTITCTLYCGTKKGITCSASLQSSSSLSSSSSPLPMSEDGTVG